MSLRVFCFLTLSLALANICPAAEPAEPAFSQATTREALSPFIKPTTRPTSRPIEQVHRALVISIDGLRPDLLLRANCPNIRAMMNRGVFTMWARTTPNSITLPSHISMMTGVNPRRHEIEWNRELKLIEPLYPRVPTLFEAAKRHGYTTAVAAGKDKFDMFDRPGVLDWHFIPHNPKKEACETPEVLRHALEIIREHQAQVMLVHLPSVDNIGHKIGWATPEQMTAIEEADAAVGQILALLEELKLTDSMLLIVTADHGGAGRNHGPDDPRSRHIPWIANAPGLRQGYDLTRNAKLTVNTEDTFATVCWMMGIPPTVYDLDGVPVKEILQPRTSELLRAAMPKPPSSW